MNKVTVTDKAYLARQEEEKKEKDSILLKPERKGKTIKWINYDKEIKKV